MKSIFSNQRAKANLQRNAFDLSRTDMFTASCGMLLPCFVEECNPNEHFSISPSSFLRTMPLNTAAFTRLKQYVDFYFVPYRLLLRQFPQFVVGTDFKVSSISQLNHYTGVLPNFSLSQTLAGLSVDYGLETESTNPNQEQKDLLGYPLWRGACRLFDLLGYGIDSESVKVSYENGWTSSTDFYETSLNPFRLAAYQKIYFDHYRNPNYELNKPSAYNLDQYMSSSSRSVPSYQSASTFNSDNELYSLRYSNYKKDYFQAIMPSFQGTDYLSQVTEAPLLGDYSFSNTMSAGSSVNDGNMLGSMSATRYTSGAFGFTIANLRSAMALDKLYRISIAAGDGDYASQIRAHYGFDYPHDDLKSTYIGSIDAPVTISEVVTTATTEQAPTGDIYGKGMSFNQSNTFTYDTKEHGIIMGIFRVLPESLYSSVGMIDRFNSKLKREDYYQPEFADLGNQPINTMEFDTDFSNQYQNEVLGFINRYAEYKTNVDKVHGAFCEGRSLASWTTPNQFSQDYMRTTKAGFFKVNPAYTNPVKSGLQYDGNEDNDIFLVNLSVQCQAVRPMSVLGLPNL